MESVMQIKDIEWSVDSCSDLDNILYKYNFNGQRITVLDRLTGYGYGVRDIETGYRDEEGNFWLASGGFDIRDYPELSREEAILKIRQNANTCVGE